MDNRVITVKFRDPKYPAGFVFPARRLPFAKDPPKVLKQGVDEGNPNYRPVIGFNPKRSQFVSVDDAGKRAVNHYTGNRYFDGGNYGESIHYFSYFSILPIDIIFLKIKLLNFFSPK